MFAASSASGSWQYLFASTRQASASYTFTRLRSMGFITEPWKNSTVVKCRLMRPSSSRSGGFRCRKTTSTSTSSRSSWRKSLRKLETLSKLICPQTTICLLNGKWVVKVLVCSCFVEMDAIFPTVDTYRRLSDLKVPLYLGREPIRSIISGIQEAKTARPTRMTRTMKVRPSVVVQ